jgi:D-alanine-D-alanine ligase
LECNFTCSVFYNSGYEGSADYILKVNDFSQADFLSMIIEEGIFRHRSKQKKYVRKGNAISGYGIYATRDLSKGECIFVGEELSQRIVTLSYVKKHWAEEDLKTFRQYAYPISEEVFILWDENPNNWAPQNHSCNANTEYFGLNVIAKKNIKCGDELTLDYAHFLDEYMEPFLCGCGSEGCRGWVTGSPKNSVTIRTKHDLH